jgi:uridine kinase
MFSLQQFFDTHTPNNDKFFTIAIDGRGGSGKTSLAKYLEVRYPDMFVLYGDDYWEPIVDPVSLGDFNNKRFTSEVIEPLKRGASFRHRSFEFASRQLIDHGMVTIEKAFCLERIYAFSFDLDWDLKLFVETPAAICFDRGFARDYPGNPNAAADWRKWQAKENAYRKRTHPKQQADVILDGTMAFEKRIK